MSPLPGVAIPEALLGRTRSARFWEVFFDVLENLPRQGPTATVVSTLFISLDGVAEIDPDWHFPYFDEAMGHAVADDYSGAEVLALGRVTHESFAGAWPGREAAGGADAAFAAELGDLRKIVATRGSQDLGWRNAERSDDIVATVAELRADEAVGKVLVAGSLSVVRQLLAAGLLDELRLLVHPVAAGRGGARRAPVRPCLPGPAAEAAALGRLPDRGRPARLRARPAAGPGDV